MTPAKKSAKAAPRPEGITQVGVAAPNPPTDQGGGTAVGVRHGSLNKNHDNVAGTYVFPTIGAIDTGDGFGVHRGALTNAHDS